MPEADTSRLGWRAKIGVITPTVNTVSEPEFNAMKPDGVSVHFTRMPIHFHPEEDGFQSLMDDLDIRLRELKTCGVDIVAYNCTVGSMACPADKLIGKLEEVSGAPAVSTTGSVLAAFAALGVTKISLATPYTEDVNQHEKEYFGGRGIEVVAMAGKDFGGDSDDDKGQEFAKVPPQEIYRHAKSVDRDEAQAIFVSCANFGSASVVEALEADLGKPVISSNTATLWAALRRGGVEARINGFGRLLREH